MEGLSNNEKVKIATDFLLQAPPGEFNEVFNDVRVLLDNDDLLKEGVAKVIAKYNMEHFVPCKYNEEEHQCLITAYSDLGNGKFYDPKTKKLFSFDHLKRQAGSITDSTKSKSELTNVDENWRKALENAFENYAKDYYPNSVTSVYNLKQNPHTSNIIGTNGNSSKVLVACLEDHNFNPKNFWNGRWRSCWVANFTSDKNGELKGVHYYEDGNVQLLAKKEVKKPFAITDADRTAQEIVKIILQEEKIYQNAMCDCYQNMSETTFKALRRQLPVTRTKIEWEKITSYKLGSELKHGGGGH